MAAIRSIGSAKTIAEKAGNRTQATALERSSKNIAAKVCRFEIVVAHIAGGANRAGGIRTHGLHVPNVAL